MFYNQRLSGFVFSAAVACLVVYGCEHAKTEHGAHNSKARPILSVVAGEDVCFSDGFSGTIEARVTTNLGFRLVGVIIKRHVHLGDVVEKGQVLATLDATQFEISVRNAESELANALAEQDKVVNDFKRQELLLQKKVITQAEFDRSQESAEAARSPVVQARAALEKASEVLDYAVLKSDINGVVTGVFAELGETVTAGKVVFSIADPSQIEAVIDVDEKVIRSVSLGGEFRVFVPPLPHECRGKVREITPQADTATRTYRVKIALEHPPESFRLGSTTKVYPNKSSAERIRLPATAILDKDDGSFVWIVHATSHQVDLIPVQISERGEHEVVVSSGIKPGERIVVAGVHSLTAGQLVHLPHGVTNESL